MMLSSGAKRARMRGRGGSARMRAVLLAGYTNSCLARSDSEGRGRNHSCNTKVSAEAITEKHEAKNPMPKAGTQKPKTHNPRPKAQTWRTPSSEHVTSSVPVDVQETSLTQLKVMVRLVEV